MLFITMCVAAFFDPMGRIVIGSIIGLFAVIIECHFLPKQWKKLGSFLAAKVRNND